LEIIRVEGIVPGVTDGRVTINIMDPSGAVMDSKRESIRSDSTFNENFSSDNQWNLSGEYTVEVTFETMSGQTMFSFTGSDSAFGYGGALGDQEIVGIEELSTLNVGGPKYYVNDSPRAEGTPIHKVMSANVCGNTLCDTPMSIEEKIKMYLQSLG